MARHKWVVWSCITHQTYGVSACFKHILALIFKALAVVRRTPGVPSRPFTPRSQVERWIRHGLEHPPIKMDDFPRKPPFNRGISQPASGLCLMKPEGSILGKNHPYQLFEGEMITLLGKHNPFTNHFKGFSVWAPGFWSLSKHNKESFVIEKFCLVAIHRHLTSLSISVYPTSIDFRISISMCALHRNVLQCTSTYYITIYIYIRIHIHTRTVRHSSWLHHYLIGGLEHFFFPFELGMSSSQLTNSYFSEGCPTTNHIHRLSMNYP